jgi:hypothetical protein
VKKYDNFINLKGKLAKGWKPHRESSNKWYVPVEGYSGNMFPYFVTGPAYVISGDALRPLYRSSINLTPIYLEDVYMTGIAAEDAGVKRMNMPMMCNVPVLVNECTFHKLMTSHKHSPEELIKLWNLVYTKTSDNCDKTDDHKAMCIRTDINSSSAHKTKKKKKFTKKQ